MMINRGPLRAGDDENEYGLEQGAWVVDDEIFSIWSIQGGEETPCSNE